MSEAKKSFGSGGDHLFEIVGYLITSAEMVASGRGPPLYSALRFLEAADRLIDLTKCVDGLKDPYLEKLKPIIKNIKLGNENTEIFANRLRELLVDIASEALKRCK